MHVPQKRFLSPEKMSSRDFKAPACKLYSDINYKTLTVTSPGVRVLYTFWNNIQRPKQGKESKL